MVNEIRIYIEGGGDDSNTKRQIRQEFSSFLKPIVEIARNKRIRWQIIIYGSRHHAFRNFKNALESHPDAYNILLVDSEAPVNKSPWEHLKDRDNWESPGVDDTHCHMMVQVMESWFIADIEALKRFYGQGFKENAIPSNSKVEKINKSALASALKIATKDTSKGEYHKIKHGAILLVQVDVAKVRSASPHCDRFFKTLAQKLDVSI